MAQYTVMAQRLEKEITSADMLAVSASSMHHHRPAVHNGIRKPSRIGDRLKLFSMLHEHMLYRLTIAADVPDNNDPSRVHVDKEPGHVFIILEQTDTMSHTRIAQVWGFYPSRPASSLVFKNIRCEIRDNGLREYNVSLTKALSREECDMIISKAAALAKKRYNINRYNCYDYAVELFNTVAGANPLPFTRVRFPFVLGRGGSPCALYADLVKMKNAGSVWTSSIHTGVFFAPASHAAGR